MPPTMCRELSTVITRKTGGVVLFVLRFLASLNECGLLWFSISAGQWLYDLKKIKQRELHGDVVTLMSEVMTFELSKYTLSANYWNH